MDERKQQVAAGYDRISERYTASKAPLSAATEMLLVALLRGRGADATVLDLGCGAGVPVTEWLAARFAVTGVDFSAQQLARARERMPGVTFIQSDMASVSFPDATFDAVVSTYAIIHLPREEQPDLLARIARWLKPGGGFLATWPLDDWEGEERDWLGWGATMWWSHHDAARNLELLTEAGFALELAEERDAGGERWLWVLARKA